MNTSRLVGTTAAMLVATSLFGSMASAQGRGQPDKRQEDQKQQGEAQQQRVSPQQQKQREDEQRRRETTYKPVLEKRVVQAQQHSEQLQQQKRTAQAAQQQQYAANLREQQQHLQKPRDYKTEPYFTTPASYRYRVSGTSRTTNEYGADMLRQAVNNGYQQGYQSGRADRQDRWPSSYQKTYGYRDANYGFNGNYIPQSDYNYYFRQGFSRGYKDGYSSRTQYGSSSNGGIAIAAAVLTGILGLAAISH